MSRWVDVPIVGGSYADDTRDWSFQDTVNWLPMRAERPGGRSLAMLRDVPGLRLKSVIGSGPYRGYRDVEGKRFVVSGTKLYQVATDFTATEIGTIPGTGPVSMTHNQVGLDGGNELVIGTVDSGYVYDTKAGTFSQITDPGFPGLQSADFIGGYIIGIEPQRRYWFHSELANAREYNTTDIYSAEAAPDRLTRVVVVGNEVVAIGERTTEVFVNQPTGNAAFQRATGVSQDKGSVSPHSIVILDNTLWMLGADGIVYRREGYNWVRKSHHAMEQDIARRDLERAFAFTYEDRGHAIYYLTFPDGKTWGFDVSQGEWARRQSYGFDRWRVSGLVRWDGAWYAGDFADGSLYLVDWEYPGLEGCDEIVRRRTLGVLHDDYNRMAVNAVQIRASSGLPESTDEPATITGDLGDGPEGEVVSFKYEAQGLVPGEELVFSISAGALPAGLSMDATGLVTGTRGAAGSYTWTVSAVDRCGSAATLEDASQTTAAPTDAFIAISGSAQMYSSEDGQTWSGGTITKLLGDTSAVPLIDSYGGKLFHFTSSSGSAVTETRTPASSGDWTLVTISECNEPVGMVYVGSKWFVIPTRWEGAVFESSDGVTFSLVSGTRVSAKSYSSITAKDAVILAGSGGSTVSRSADSGATWTLGIATGHESASNNIVALATDAGFCAFGHLDNQSIMFSTTGEAGTWSAKTNPQTGVNSGIHIAAFGGGRVVGIHRSGAVSYSTDGGQTWLAGGTAPLWDDTLPTMDNKLAYCNGLFVFATAIASTHPRAIYTSPDGVTWTERFKTTTTNFITSVTPWRLGGEL